MTAAARAIPAPVQTFALDTGARALVLPLVVPTRDALEDACRASEAQSRPLEVMPGYAVEAEHVRSYEPPTSRKDDRARPVIRWIYVLHIPGDLTLGGYDTPEAFARFAERYLREIVDGQREVSRPWG